MGQELEPHKPADKGLGEGGQGTDKPGACILYVTGKG